MRSIDKDLKAVQEARVLMEEAAQAKKTLALFEQHQLDRITEQMLRGIRPRLEALVRQSVQETGRGCEADELRLCRMLAEGMENSLAGMKCVGVLEQDEENGLLEIGVPMGVIAAAVPSISPVAAVLCAAVTAVKAGNAVVFAPHPAAAGVTAQTAAVLAQSAEEAGLPKGALACAETAAREGALAMFRHPHAALILNMGRCSLLEEAAATGKPVLYGGIAPGPAFIEKTADLEKAAADIVASRSFNNGMGPGGEQYVVADRQIAEAATAQLKRQGAYFMTAEEQKQLTALLGLHPHCTAGADKAYIGKSACWLAAKAGFMVPEGTRVLVSQQAYITDYNPYANGLLCPVMAFYIEADWTYACEKCIELLVNGSKGNTLAIHSRDPEVIRQFALKKPVGRVLINTPAVMGAAGVTTRLFPTVILGSVSAGQGITADNISPMNLIYRRKAAFGMRGFSSNQ